MNKKTVLWILIAIIITLAVWGMLSLFNISLLKGSAPTTSKLPESTENKDAQSDVYPGVELDEKTWQGEVLSIEDETFTLRVNGKEHTFLFDSNSKRQFELLEIEPGNVAIVEFSEADGNKTAIYVEKVISY